jgi:hypothetical protein
MITSLGQKVEPFADSIIMSMSMLWGSSQNKGLVLGSIVKIMAEMVFILILIIFIASDNQVFPKINFFMFKNKNLQYFYYFFDRIFIGITSNIELNIIASSYRIFQKCQNSLLFCVEI